MLQLYLHHPFEEHGSLPLVERDRKEREGVGVRGCVLCIVSLCSASKLMRVILYCISSSKFPNKRHREELIQALFKDAEVGKKREL